MPRSQATKPKPTRLRRFLRLAEYGVAGMFLFAAGVAIHISRESQPYRFENASSIRQDRVAIVFGALVTSNGLSDVLRDRVDAGIELYRAGTVKKLLMSGDNRFVHYNEPEAMRQYAIEKGIPAEDVVADFAGRDTYDTCYRAKHIFGLDSAVLVTQRFHAPRAVYIARGVGIDAVCYGVADFEKYPQWRVKSSVREYMVDMKAWWEVNVSKRPAKIMGSREPAL